MQAHPTTIPLINKPVRNYDGLSIIYEDDSTTGSYTTSLFGNIEERLGEEEDIELKDRLYQTSRNNEDNSERNSSPPVNSSPAISVTIRPQLALRRGDIQADGSSMADLIFAINRKAVTSENPIRVRVRS